MWSNLPMDLLANVFSFLSPDCLARARTACRNWHTCSESYPSTASMSSSRRGHQPWFLALPMRNHKLYCYAHNPIIDNWYVLSLSFLQNPVRPVAAIGNVVLLKATNSTTLQLGLCNPFTKQFRHLPMLNIARTNPAVGVVVMGPGPGPHGPIPHFRVYVAGGMLVTPHKISTYESTLEMYDSGRDRWQVVGSTPVGFAVRLTVWAPKEGVYSNGVLYWVTSARAYTIMGFEIGTNTWRELSVPSASQLDFAALVSRNGRLTLVGGTSGRDACVWELGEGDKWEVIEKVPMGMKRRFLGGIKSWGSTKCVGSDGFVCLYREFGLGMLVWRKVGEKGRWEWEWSWVEGCGSIKGQKVTQTIPIKGVLFHPNLAPWPMLQS